MALRTDIQYVQFYMDGSTARKLEKQAERKHAAPAVKGRRASRKIVLADPGALIGVLITVCLLAAMVAGFLEYRQAQEQVRQMNDYVVSLQQENVQLQQTYREGYDLDQIREIATAVGMIPAEQAPRVEIQVQVPPEETVEPSLWESFATFLTGLFA